MTNLFETILGALPADAGDRLGAHLDEPADAALTGLSGAVPLLLGAFAARAASASDLDGLLALVAEGLEGGSDLLSNPEALLSGAAAATGPGRLAGRILGDRLEPTAAEVARFFGLKPASAQALLHMSGPLITGGIGRVLGAKPSALAVRDLLVVQSASYATVLPAELRRLVAPVAPAAVALVGDHRRPGPWKWLLLGGIAAAVLAWLFIGRPGARFVLPDLAESAAVDTAPVADPLAALTAPAGAAVVLEEQGEQPRVTVFFADPMAGGADIGAPADPRDLTPAAAALKAYLTAHPAARVQIAGPAADGDGGELATARRQWLRDALIAAGVAGDRLDNVAADSPTDGPAGDPADDPTATRRADVQVVD